jgi:predicted Zn-ribbon and HTH transcriptional regulator
VPKRTLEIADIFRNYGLEWRRANKGHVGLNQLKVMSSIEACRTEALGGHVAACTKCNHQHIAYNSCKNRHCPKCQGPAARDWMAARSEDLLPVEYFHVVFTLPAADCPDRLLEQEGSLWLGVPRVCSDGGHHCR